MKTIQLYIALLLSVTPIFASEIAEVIVTRMDVTLFPELNGADKKDHPIYSNYTHDQAEIMKERAKGAKVAYEQLMVEYLDSKFTETELKELDTLLTNPLFERFSQTMNFKLDDGSDYQTKLSEIASSVYEGLSPAQVDPVE
jgi:hypothetical protein